jgi:hypothetical protein
MEPAAETPSADLRVVVHAVILSSSRTTVVEVFIYFPAEENRPSLIRVSTDSE